jgi:NADP-dependent 3-hydroxy acid dehydrogenase YdfG
VTRAALPGAPALGARPRHHGSAPCPVSAPRGSAGFAYIAAKHGVLGFSATIQVEERKHGIRATAIHPGEVDTPILEKRPTPRAAERRRVLLRSEDVAEAVLFVATRPPGVVIPTLVIEPLAQDT